MDQTIDRELLKRFIAGACSAEEKLRVNHFLQTREGPAFFNLVMQEQWEEVENFDLPTESLFKWKDQLDERLGLQQIELKEHQTIPGSYFFRNAAIWTGIILGVAAYTFFNLKNNATTNQKTTVILEEKVNPYGRRSSFLLSDSTKVYLGAGSKLFFSKTFAGNERTVRLVGEAYFEVTKNPKKPFVIYTGSERTMVLGTSFKINAFPGKALTVAVTTGKVRVDHIAANQKLQSLAMLTPGLKLTYNQGKAITDQVSVDDTKKWKEGLLVFKAVPLHQLVAEIGRWYNVSVSIRRKSLKDIPVSVTLDANVPVNKLLDGLAVVTGLKYEFINKNEVTIY